MFENGILQSASQVCCQLQATMTGAGETENETFSVECWDLYTLLHTTL